MKSIGKTGRDLWLTGALATAVWMVCTLGHVLLTRTAQLPTQFVDLLVPSPWGHRLQTMAQPWPLLSAVLCAVAVGVLAVMLLHAVHSRTGAGPGFAASWICVAVAALAATGLAGLGLVIADWPPARLAWIVQDLQPMLGTAAYWAFIWGWIPGLGLRLLTARRAGQHRAPDAMAPVLLVSVLVSLLLVTTVVQARQASLTATQTPPTAPEPVPVPSPVAYGWPEVSDATVEAGVNWCTGEQVEISWGQTEAATGHRALAIGLENTSQTSCELQAYPDVVFNDTTGNAMEVLLVHGGSFMTRDSGPGGVNLAAGGHAVAYLGWNAMAAAGDTSVGSMLVAPYPGAVRQQAPAALDIVHGGAVAVTAWEQAPDGAQGTEQQTPRP